MPRVDLTLESKIERTPRVLQVEGQFDMPATEKTRVAYHFDVPLHERDWRVGLVVGPSGAGKSSVARALFGENLIDGYAWQPRRAIVDGFGDTPVRDITAALSSVGFSSPPAWVRPFEVLSNGERFRANMARVLVDERPLVAVDEFTSVVDRQAAQIGSHTIQKHIRSRATKQFVAVTCHYDVEEWLQPDWVLEPHLGRFAWRSLQRRPQVEVELVRCSREAWRWFAPHHYMTAELHKAAKCFVGLVAGKPAAFAGLLHFPHPAARDVQALSRLVVLPEYQGLGLGAYAFTEAVGRVCAANGTRMHVGTAHPALIRSWAKSQLWLMIQKPRFANKVGKTSSIASLNNSVATRRAVAHFVWRGGAFADEEQNRTARLMWA